MIKLTKLTLLNDYNKFVSKAQYLAKKNDLKGALTFIDASIRIAYNFNFIYTDDRLESLLKFVAEQKLDKCNFIPVSNRYVFYDYFGNTKVLTQQYIRALMSWNVEFLYILENGSESDNSEIIDEIRACSKAKIVILTGADPFDKMRQAQAVIADFKPSKAFLHLAPWDLVGVCLWNTLPQVVRFLINLTDHAFWVGTSCTDFVLEFRTYGFNLSKDARKIPEKKLLLQPYYPIQNDVAFNGFPVDLKDKIVGFSGSSFYKIYGRQGKFLNLIKSILLENENFVFLLAGWGIDSPIKKFINDNGFQERFILLGERKDIDQVFKRIDIFINTYPFIGGLMTQLAVKNNKAIASYTSKDLTFNFIEDFLTIDRKKAGSIKDETSFLLEMNNLIRDINYRNKNIQLYSGSIPSVQDFNDTLWMNCNISYDNNVNNVPSIEINYEAILGLYLEVENDFLKIYQKLKLVNLKFLYFRYFPISAIRSIFLVLLLDFKTVKRNFKDLIKKLI